jgi:hypothetical protein
MRFSLSAVPLALAGSAFATPTLQQMLGFLQQFNAVCATLQSMILFLRTFPLQDFSYPQNVQAAKSINYTGFSEGRRCFPWPRSVD